MYRKLLPTLLSVIFIALLWQLISIKIDYPAIFPSLSQLFVQLLQLFESTDFALIVFSTVLRAVFGFIIAFVSAFIISSVSAFSAFWKNFFHPIIVISRSVPVISFVLLALLWFAPEQLPVFIALLTMFPILYQNILTGLENTDIRWLEMAKVHQKSFLFQFFYIYLPASKSNIYDGISTSLGFGWRAVIIGEVLAQPIRGIGTAMKDAQAFINVSEIIAWTIVAVLLSYLFDLIIKLVRRINFKKNFHNQTSSSFVLNSQVSHKQNIEVVNLQKRFNEKIVFHSFNHEFNSEIISCLKSPSGKGKTTLLRILSGLDKDYSGQVLKPSNLKTGYAFQDFRLLPWLTVSENIMFSMDQKKHTTQKSKDLTAFLMEKMELQNEANNYPAQLSGGQQQRVSLARALAAEPDILLLDEPLSGLDETLKLKIVVFLTEWISATKPIVIWATHENINVENIAVNELFI